MDPASDVDTLREDLTELRADFASMTENVKQLAGDSVEAGAHKTRDGFQNVSGGLKSHPFISMFSALGVGLILGWLSNHKRSQ